MTDHQSPARTGVPRIALLSSGAVVIAVGIVIAVTVSLPIGLAIVAVELVSLPFVLRVVGGGAAGDRAAAPRADATASGSDAARAFGAED